jgi:cytochrome c-type biogenesis protein CcmH
MITFWITTTLLLAIALLLILRPLLVHGSMGAIAHRNIASIYQDQLSELDADLKTGTISPDQYAISKREIEQRIVDEMPAAMDADTAVSSPDKYRHATAIVIALGFPLCAVLLYLYLGHQDALNPATVAATQPGDHAVSKEQIATMVERLAARLKDKPEDANGWQMLARSYVAFGRFADATDAFQHAVALTPNDPQLLADYADAVGAVNGGDLNGKPKELIDAALKLDPNHQKSLSLAGTVAFNNRDFKGAVDYWQRLQKTLAPESDDALSTSKNIEEARAAAAASRNAVTSASPLPASHSSAAVPSASTAHSSTISGTLSLSPSLAGQAAPNDTVFIFARVISPIAIGGTNRMPLAIVRAQVKDLPMHFTLDDSTAMSPTAKLSNHSEVSLNARISKSGNAVPQSGDLSGSIHTVKLGSTGVRLLIDTAVP